MYGPDASPGVQVAVVGAGAIGCTLGALLGRAGHEVSLVARGEQLEALRKGLRLDVPGASLTLQPRVADHLEGDPELLVLATKRADLEAACRQAASVSRRATVLAIQNGLGAEAIAARHFDDVAGGVTGIVAQVVSPARVEAVKLGMVIGREGRPVDARAMDIARALSQAGIPSRTTDNLAGARWTKLIVNLNNALPAATGLGVRALYAQPGIPALAARMLREGVLVADAEKVRLETLALASARALRAIAVLPTPVAASIVAARARRLTREGDIEGSMLQDLRRGRTTEVRDLNGALVERARRHGLPTPVNAALVGAVERVERGERFMSASELARLA